MEKRRRINLYSGPGAGKSTTAAIIFAELKKKGISVELVDEYIKFWTYIPRVPKNFDCLYCQAKQVHKEDTILRAGVDLIVSDSPIPLQYFYAKHHKNPCQKQMFEISMEFEEMYPSVNILLKRDDADYKELGRYETLEQAKEIDDEFQQYMYDINACFATYPSHESEAIVNYVMGMIAD